MNENDIDLEKLKQKLLNAKNQNELVKAMQEMNLWMNQSTMGIKPGHLKNNFDFGVAEKRKKHEFSLKPKPENRLKVKMQQIGYTTNESEFMDGINRARKAGLSSKDVEQLKQMGLESLLED